MTPTRLPKDLTPSQISAWLRERGQRFLDMANEIDSAFGQFKHTESRRVVGSEQVPSEDQENELINDARNLLENRSMRLSDLAKSVGISTRLLRHILTQEQGFERNNRGWYSLLDQQEDQREEHFGYDQE